MRNGYQQYCARCKKNISDGETTGESQIYMSHHILCEPCFFDEEREIDEAGTNNLPDTLKSYGKTNDHY